ncbi:MAG: ABC transporter ATP-binding protein [Deltaproteobacteria bacterium]|nr:ABC transporter ATP-binding protein [Deltaproteobacteria bacterium]
MTVECRNVTKTFLYPKENKGIFALIDINLKVEKNEFVCLIGPSGCGKTTLVHMIAGFEDPTAGRILVDGRSVNGPSPERGVIFQEDSLFPWQTVLENIVFGLKAQGVSRRKRDGMARRYLDLVGLKGFDNARPHQLSGGMKQKVAIARTLALQPEILLMDEPFGSLDEQTRLRLDFELLNIWEEDRKTVIFVTHSIEEAILLADRIILFTKRPGRIQKVVTLDIPRPRNMFAPDVTEVRKELLEDLMLCCPPEEPTQLITG